MTFREVKIGQWFDFIKPGSIYNSFFKRVQKVSARKYRDRDGIEYRVGSITCDVYHVGETADFITT